MSANCFVGSTDELSNQEEMPNTVHLTRQRATREDRRCAVKYCAFWEAGRGRGGQVDLDQQRAAVCKLCVTHTHPLDEVSRQVGPGGCVGSPRFAWQWCEG